MRSRSLALPLHPGPPAPIRNLNTLKVDLVLHPLPEHPSVAGGRHVGEHRVLEHRLHGDRVARRAGARRDTEEAVLGVDRPQHAVLVESHPGDVVTDALHLVTGEGGRHHRKVGLAAGGGEGGRDVALLALGVGDADDLGGNFD